MPTNQPPVDAIQGEARAREVIQADRKWAAFAGASIWNPLWADTLAESVLRGARDDTDLVQAFARHRAAFQSEARAVPSASLPADREAIAREMYERFVEENGGFYNEGTGCGFGTWEELPDKTTWLSAAGFCLALSPTPSAGRDGGEEDIPAMAQFLCDRLDNLDWQDFEDTTRDFMGHVDPALSRLKKALAALPPATEKAGK